VPKLQVNDDGSITIPLRNQKPAITLLEPSMAELAWLTERIEEVDSALPQVPTTRAETASAEEMEIWQKATLERTRAIYSGALPYGSLLIEMIEKFGGTDTYTTDDFYSWAASPAVIRTIVETFRAPLPGAG
jgi:hypothetical protein